MVNFPCTSLPGEYVFPVIERLYTNVSSVKLSVGRGVAAKRLVVNVHKKTNTNKLKTIFLMLSIVSYLDAVYKSLTAF